MEDLYGNLENYNEENTIAELQAENKELKCKLEEYAATLSKLQKDFDVLSSEYKKLETNYSSLLKTAKAEIERKTQIITNLNLEKDKMILKSFQNRNTRPNRPRDNSRAHNKMDVDKKCEKEKQPEGCKISTPLCETERKDRNNSKSTIDLRSKLLSLSNSGDHPPSEKIETKENTIQDRKDDDSGKARESIRNRRKSMPAFGIEKDELSPDNNNIGGSSTSKQLKNNVDHNFHDKQKHAGERYLHDSSKSKISDTVSLEERQSGYYETLPDSNKQRYGRYDKEPSDRYRGRHRSSHRYKRESPDRYQSGPREYHDNYHRSESDRHRHAGRVLESPPRDKYQRHSRERYRNYERSQYQEYDKLPPQNPEKYPTKRKIEHGFDEADSKRTRLEPQNENLEGEKKVEHHKNIMNKNYVTDPLEIQFSSCESPDYNYLEVPHQQVKEIKLTATTKLDDPRKSSSKYVLKNDKGKSILYAATGQHVDILPLNIKWGSTPMSIPEALVKMPALEIGQNAGYLCTDIENPINVSMESGEISDHEDIPPEKQPTNGNKTSILRIKKIHPPAAVPKADDIKNIDKSLQNITSYKIPKLKKNADEKHSQNNSIVDQNCKEDSSAKTYVCDISHLPNNKKSDNIKSIDVNKQLLCLAKGKKLNEGNKCKQKKSDIFQSNVQLPCLENKDVYKQKAHTAQEVVQGDLEMSDDNDDEDEQVEKISKEVIPNMEKSATENTEHASSDPEKQLPVVTETFDLEEHCDEKVFVINSKKSKSHKKKSKHKDTKGCCSKTKDFEKLPKSPEYEKGTKSNHIKSKFSELFDDSSSLINPEDLGVAAVLASTTRLPDKCVPFFEDAVDATDLNTIKRTSEIPLQEPIIKENVLHNDDPVINLCDPVDNESNDKIVSKTCAITDEDIESIYKNLEPGVPEQEENVQTVVISTGVQPPVVIEDKDEAVAHKQLLGKAIQTLALEALATSTPHKPWKIHAEDSGTDIKLPETSCNSNTVNNSSQMETVDNTAVMDRSDNTMASQPQTSTGNVPDVRIFVKRRRKIAKK